MVTSVLMLGASPDDPRRSRRATASSYEPPRTRPSCDCRSTVSLSHATRS